MFNEDSPITSEEATQAVLLVLSDRVFGNELAQVRHVMPKQVPALWPTMTLTE